MAGATAATVGGFLGGHLAFRRASGANHAAGAPSTEQWTAIEVDGALDAEGPALAHLEGAPLAAVGGEARVRAARGSGPARRPSPADTLTSRTD